MCIVANCGYPVSSKSQNPREEAYLERSCCCHTEWLPLRSTPRSTCVVWQDVFPGETHASKAHGVWLHALVSSGDLQLHASTHPRRKAQSVTSSSLYIFSRSSAGRRKKPRIGSAAVSMVVYGRGGRGTRRQGLCFSEGDVLCRAICGGNISIYSQPLDVTWQ
jgi:hypothetical protein